jgi:hypothetical protein
MRKMTDKELDDVYPLCADHDDFAETGCCTDCGDCIDCECWRDGLDLEDQVAILLEDHCPVCGDHDPYACVCGCNDPDAVPF